MYLILLNRKSNNNLKVFFLPGGLTGAGARITGAFGDIFAKLSFDDDFIDQRQQQKVKPSKFSSKVGGFFKVSGRGFKSLIIICYYL